MPKVSVIIPAYNAAQYVADSIDSVISQTYKDYEIIIIDDGSTDSTGSIVRECITAAGPRPEIRYIYQENAGPSSARNKGIKEAKGDYIAFLDADDEWLPSKLENQINRLDEKGISAGFAYTDYYVCDDLMNIISAHKCPSFVRKDMEHALLIKNRISTPTLLIRKSCFDVVGLFDESLHVAEDWDMWIRLIRKYDCVHVPEPLVKVRILTKSQSSGGEKNIESEERFLNKIFSKSGNRELYYLKNKSFAYRYFCAAWAFYSNSDIINARKYIIKSVFTYPLPIREGKSGRYKLFLKLLLTR